MRYSCPVCLFDDMPYPPRDYDICPCCGTEFGNDDAEYSHDELRAAWIANGAQWFFEQPPDGWSPWSQLIEGGRPDLVPEAPVSFYESLWGEVGMLEDNVSNEPNAIQSPPSNEKVLAHSMIG